MARLSKEQQLAELDKLIAEQQAVRDKLQSELKAEDRKRQARKAFVAGEVMLKHGDQAMLLALVRAHVKSKSDRAIFDLSD